MSRMRDGHSTTIDIPGAAGIAGVRFFEVEVTPPGYDAGGPNDTTTMRNLSMRTRQPKKLKTLTAMTIRVAWDPLIYGNATGIGALVGLNTIIRVNFSDADNSFITFWGWLDKFTPDRSREGEQPTAEITIEPSNQDNDFLERIVGVNNATPPLAA